uniref:Condensin complex subunit 1 n=1 Tax=Caenorhabditis tropicalis TaxID=1561998 RepID=A0A1I7V355_9PELO
MAKDVDYPQGCLPIEPTTSVSQQIERLRDVYIHIFHSLRGLGEFTTDSPKFNQYYELLQTVSQEDFLKPISSLSDERDDALEEDEEKKETGSQITVTRILLKEILNIPSCSSWTKNVRRDQKAKEGPGTSVDFNDDEDDDEDKIDRVERLLVDIAKRAIGQIEPVPHEVLDVLFYHIINPQRTNFKEARYLAESIINACLTDFDSFGATIHSVMTSAAKEGKLPKQFELTGSNNRNKFFEVLRYLHYISYDLVSGAVQELNFWLQSENGTYRKEAVKIVGMLTRDPHCQFGMDNNDATWAAFLTASGDPEEEVRHEFVEQSKEILISNHSHLRGHVISSLARLGKDDSELIRIAVVEAVTQVAKSKLEVISDRLLKACAERMKDKKPKVRERAIKTLMDLYFHLMTSRPQPFFTRDGNKQTKETSESSQMYTDSEKESVQFIPDFVFDLYRILKRSNSHHDARFTIERYLQKYLVPFEVDAPKRVQILARLYRGLEDIPRMMFGDVISRSSQLRRALMGILSQVGNSKKMTPENSAQLKERIHRLCQLFPEPVTLEKIMIVFVNQIAENEEAFNLVKKIMADKYTTAENQNSVLALKQILEKKVGSKSNQTVFRHFIDRVCPLSFDRLLAKHFVDLVADTVSAKIKMENWAQGCFEKDLSLLKLLADHYAHIFTDENIVDKIRADILLSEEPLAVESAIHAFSRIFANSNYRAELDNEATRKKKWYLSLIKNLKEFSMRDEPELRRSSKLSTRLLANLIGKEKAIEYFDSEIDTLIDRLHIESAGAANSFQVLAEIFLTSPSHYLSKMLGIIESDRIGQLIMTSPEYSDDDPNEFVEKTHMEKQPWPKYTMAKVYAAKFAAKVLSAFNLISSSEEKKQMDGAAQKFIDLLCEILEKKAQFGENQCDVEKARIRSTASACLLKLAAVLAYRPKFHTRLFKNMSYMITDEAYCVRLHYSFHVKKGLGRKLPIEFAACYGLVNLESTEDERENTSNGFKFICINQAHQIFSDRNEEKADLLKLEGAQRAVFCSETVIAYVVWLLANHYKLDKIEENASKDDSNEELARKVANVNLLYKLKESLWLVIDALRVGKCNMQKVWKVLEKLKTCGDKSIRNNGKLTIAQIREHNKKLWALCDLGISMMLYRAKLQMEDQDSREAGFNLQFFYVCNEKDKADPSNVYAPDVLINDEKQRNGKLPKAGRVFHVSDLTSEFTPPPQNNESIASTSSRNTSKRGGGNTSLNKTKGGKSSKRRSGGSKLSDDEETAIKVTPAVKKTRSKRGTYDLPEEDDEDAEEVIPAPKRRGAPPVSSEPSSSNGITKNAISPKKQSSRKSNGKQISTEETVTEHSSDDEEIKNSTEVSLDNIGLSPILNQSRRSARTVAEKAKITASTPLVASNPKSIKRKRGNESQETREEEKEANHRKKDTKSPSPKKRVSIRRGSSSTSKSTTASPLKQTTSRRKPAVTANGSSPKKNKYGLSLEEEDNDEEEQGTSTTRSSLRTRTSTRLTKK